jgi:F-type H+-transporting ATPase subunit b
VFEALGIDWKQALTHLVSFALTLWLLKVFAWKPLLNLLDERRKKIADEFDQIEMGKAGVAELSASYEAKLKDIDSERRAKLVEAVEEGKKVAGEIKAHAQQEVKQLHDKAKADLQREVDKAKVQLRDDLVTMTITATEKVIYEKLDDAKHRQLINRFIDNMEKV